MLVAEEEDGDIMPLVVLIMVLPTVRREACDHDQYGPSPSNFPALFSGFTIRIRFRELPEYGRSGGKGRWAKSEMSVGRMTEENGGHCCVEIYSSLKECSFTLGLSSTIMISCISPHHLSCTLAIFNSLLSGLLMIRIFCGISHMGFVHLNVDHHGPKLFLGPDPTAFTTSWASSQHMARDLGSNFDDRAHALFPFFK